MATQPSGTGIPASHSHAAEYRSIRSDLVRVFVLNAVYLALVLLLYFYERRTGALAAWFSARLQF